MLFRSEDVVPDRAAAEVDGVEGHGVAAARGHLDGAERRVHLWGDGCDGSVDDRAWVVLVVCAGRRGCVVVSCSVVRCVVGWGKGGYYHS